MEFSEIVGQKYLKNHLENSVESGRIPHAQLFVGPTGSGLLPMAIAYATKILCLNHEVGTKEHESCKNKLNKLVHPDLHFIYPVNTNDEIKKNAVSSNFTQAWREFVFANPYGSLFDWLKSLGIENKQGNISVNEALDLIKTLSLKSYEGGYKIMVIWMAEKMNTECANKILKIVEEPPEKTLLLLLTENPEHILTTISSRCQKLHFPPLAENDITNYLMSKFDLSGSEANKLSRQANGDINKALHIFQNDNNDALFEAWFVSWARAAFKAKGNKSAINELINWSDTIAKQGRETQKKFLTHCIDIFRQALLKNYKADALVDFESMDSNFSIDKFAPFIHQNNIYLIFEALESATYHIERNGNSKIILTDLSIQLTRLIHKKEAI